MSPIDVPYPTTLCNGPPMLTLPHCALAQDFEFNRKAFGDNPWKREEKYAKCQGPLSLRFIQLLKILRLALWPCTQEALTQTLLFILFRCKLSWPREKWWLRPGWSRWSDMYLRLPRLHSEFQHYLGYSFCLFFNTKEQKWAIVGSKNTTVLNRMWSRANTDVVDFNFRFIVWLCSEYTSVLSFCIKN